MKLIIGIIVLLAGIQIQAQILTTNKITAVPSFREVDGKLYNTLRSVKWGAREAHCLQVTTNGIVVALVEPTFSRYDQAPFWPENGQYMGLNPSMQVRTGEKETGVVIFLKNYPEQAAVTKLISFRSMPVGTIEHDGQVLELHDCGLPHVVTIIKTNWPSGQLSQK